MTADNHKAENGERIGVKYGWKTGSLLLFIELPISWVNNQVKFMTHLPFLIISSSGWWGVAQTLHISMFCYCAMVDPIVTKIEINAKRKPIKFFYKSPLNRVDLIVTKIERNVLMYWVYFALKILKKWVYSTDYSFLVCHLFTYCLPLMYNNSCRHECK